MRKIEEEMNQAILNDMDFNSSNTAVRHNEDGFLYVQLHGNTIAFDTSQGWYINLCDWNTSTTRSRLNALSNVIGHGTWLGVHQKDFMVYCDIRHGSYQISTSQSIYVE